MDANNISRFWSDLFYWFGISGREFPWRRTSNPYAILIAEKLLQKTRAGDIVVGAYLQLLSKYPTVNHLAKANITELKDLIRPLGLAFRAEHLLTLAKEIIEDYGSKVPSNLQELLRLTGIGQYCARAVMSFAFGQDVPVVDTNMARFLRRFYNLKGPRPKTPTRDKKLINMAYNLVPEGRSKEFNLAILDLCALVCRVKKPLCEKCRRCQV